MSGLEEFWVSLSNIGAIKYGEFVLKSGIKSPVYLDLRTLVSHPKLMAQVSRFLWKCLPHGSSKPDSLCGVPYTALPLATVISIDENIPMIIRRKEAKSYGTKKILEGDTTPGIKVLIVEDIVTSGSSILETAKALREHGLIVEDAVVVVDRCQGGLAALARNGIKLHSLVTLKELTKILITKNCISSALQEKINVFIEDNQFGNKSIPDITKESLENRMTSCTNPVARKLIKIIVSKKTNLCLSADVMSFEKLLSLCELVGCHVCCIKVHSDLLPPSERSRLSELRAIADKENFLLFEDRKFADIGNTVAMQFKEVSEWADIVTVHGLPGPGVLEGIKSVKSMIDHGVLIVSEMSTKGNLINSEYSNECVKLAEDQLVIGLVCQSRLSQKPNLLQFTPGVNSETNEDGLSQTYVTPKQAIFEKNADIIIVGRGIIKQKDPLQAAKHYKTLGWQAYVERITSN